jgi:rsbT co-antagonist protein RsbR
MAAGGWYAQYACSHSKNCDSNQGVLLPGEDGLKTGQATIDVLAENFDGLLSSWISVQSDEGVQRTDIFSSSEGREQSRRLLQALRKGAETGDLQSIDLNEGAWSALRDELKVISRERTERGVTPTQMANFVNALKPPVFKLLVERCAGGQELTEELTTATRLVDAFALYTTEVFQAAREKVIERQRQEVSELSSPVVELWTGILTVPLIGSLDSARAQEVMENLLQAIVERRAEIAVIDITGVGTVDTQVAQHLLRTADAVRLMGAECIISGISPTIAQTMVELGVDVGDVITRSSIKDALTYGFNRLGLGVHTLKGREHGRV